MRCKVSFVPTAPANGQFFAEDALFMDHLGPAQRNLPPSKPGLETHFFWKSVLVVNDKLRPFLVPLTRWDSAARWRRSTTESSAPAAAAQPRGAERKSVAFPKVKWQWVESKPFWDPILVGR